MVDMGLVVSVILLLLPCSLASQSVAQPRQGDPRWLDSMHFATHKFQTFSSICPKGEDKRRYFRFLNLITWVKFDNEECAADTGDNGTCYTRCWRQLYLKSYLKFLTFLWSNTLYHDNPSPQPSSSISDACSTECAQYGGVAQGTCAAGFGVCCVLQVPPCCVLKAFSWTLKLSSHQTHRSTGCLEKNLL